MKAILRRLFRRRQLDDDVREELESHIAMRAELNRESGMPPNEALRDARARSSQIVGLVVAHGLRLTMFGLTQGLRIRLARQRRIRNRSVAGHRGKMVYASRIEFGPYVLRTSRTGRSSPSLMSMVETETSHRSSSCFSPTRTLVSAALKLGRNRKHTRLPRAEPARSTAGYEEYTLIGREGVSDQRVW